MAWLVITIPEGRGPQPCLGAVYPTETDAKAVAERQRLHAPMATIVTVEVALG